LLGVKSYVALPPVLIAETHLNKLQPDRVNPNEDFEEPLISKPSES
jgi:hypothetical protein